MITNSLWSKFQNNDHAGWVVLVVSIVQSTSKVFLGHHRGQGQGQDNGVRAGAQAGAEVVGSRSELELASGLA